MPHSSHVSSNKLVVLQPPMQLPRTIPTHVTTPASPLVSSHPSSPSPSSPVAHSSLNLSIPSNSPSAVFPSIAPTQSQLPQVSPTPNMQPTRHLHWEKAMQDEYKALLQNNIWALVYIPTGHNFLNCKWVYKVKKNSDGSFQRCRV
ncbi:hypothetical protein LIER_19362 [Lithospermum erythrorhizon]|uniref:Uncharacterized protein n=1 Tax=Lithospermum erythrorhizon TaxID=34254 RepID=A0AAV3QKG4_LITER